MNSDREDVMKILARCSFLLVTVLWGSFYTVAKVALTHVDPILFTFFEALVLVPIALTLLVMQRNALTQNVLKRGILLGSCLCIATLTITVSEKFTGATNTAFFPSTGGTFAAIITAVVFGRSLAKSIWVACLLSLLGVLLILHASLSGLELRGDIIALLGALLFTVYLFLVDQDAQQEGGQFWAILGIEHLSFALWMMLFSLLFGDWQHFHPVLSHDIPVILYVSLICTFLPVILTHFAHRHIDPLETGFISVLEPLWGAIIAHMYLGEVVSLPMYLGGGLIISGTIVHLIGGGNLPQFYQMMIGMIQKGTINTRSTLKKWVSLASILSSLLFMSQMFTWKRQNAPQASLHYSNDLLHRGLLNTLPLRFWLPLLADKTRCGYRNAMSKQAIHMFLSVQIATVYGWMKAQTRVLHSLIWSFSVWHVLCIGSSSITLFLEHAQATVWQRQPQHLVPP